MSTAHGIAKETGPKAPVLSGLKLAMKTDEMFAAQLEASRVTTVATLEILEQNAEEASLAAALPHEPGVADLLAEADQLIATGRLPEALELADRILTMSPGEAGAHWITARCWAKLGDDRAALQSLARLRAAVQDQSLQRPAESLLSAVRQRLTGRLTAQTARLLKQNAAAEAVAMLVEFVTLDPTCPSFSWLLAGSLAVCDREAEAIAVIDKLLATGPGPDNEAQLTALKRQIQDQLAQTRLASAREQFLLGNYQEARDALNAVDGTVRALPLFRTFDGYLARLVRSSPKAAGGVVPPGVPEEVDQLYFFLVGEDVRQASNAFRSGDLPSCIEHAERALAVCPRFPYANYIYGMALVSVLTIALSKRRPLAEQAIHEPLKRARDALRIASLDPEVGSSAGTALAKLEDLVEALADADGRGTDDVNALASEWGRIKAGIIQGVSSREQLRSTIERVVDLAARLREARSTVTSKTARERLVSLQPEVDDYLTQLTAAETAGLLAARLQEVMASLSSRRRGSSADTAAVKSQLSALRRDAERARRVITVDSAKEVVGKILQAVTVAEGQL